MGPEMTLNWRGSGDTNRSLSTAGRREGDAWVEGGWDVGVVVVEAIIAQWVRDRSNWEISQSRHLQTGQG